MHGAPTIARGTWALLIALLAISSVKASYVGRSIWYNTTSQRQEAPAKNVHIVCHTHDDPGWLKTVDQYHYGSNNSIQVAGVQYILDSVVQSLLQDQNRKFVFAETSYFVRWWREQSQNMQRDVRQLVNDGRLDFVNGGWVQNDEAASHYVGMIDQTTRGHRFLQEEFGKVPTVGWQIDPFGHSSTQASLSALYGFDAQFFGRADYQDMEVRKRDRQLELLWRGSESLGAAADLFTGNFASGNYGPPPGFNWDWGQADPQIQDDPRLVDYNVPERLEAFVSECDKLFNVTRGNDIMLTMGSDFTYANAHAYYKNIDKLIHYANRDGRLNVFYSTPAAYVAAKHAYREPWPLKTDDFFPYADCPHCYWTGYFTSRPAAKAYIRSNSANLQAARQLEMLAQDGNDGDSPSTDRLEEAVSLAHHHDAVTGTAKQHVADDYNMRIAAGREEADAVARRGLEALLLRRDDSLDAGIAPTAADATLGLRQCALLNISVCEATVEASSEGRGFGMVAYNPLGWDRREPVRLPVTGATVWTVIDADSEAEVPSQLVPINRATRQLQHRAEAAGELSGDRRDARGDHELVFMIDLPALGFRVYHVRPQDSAPGTVGATQSGLDAPFLPRAGHETVLGVADSYVEVTGLKFRGAASDINISLAWYNASDGADGAIASGAYIFRPNGSYPIADASKQDASVSMAAHGPVLTEFWSSPTQWTHLVCRAWEGEQYLEVEWTVGPIPVDDGLGKEVVIRYTSDLESGDEVYTDANGREMLRRVRDRRPTWDLNVTEPTAGNYYPVTAAMYISDENRTLTVHTDRAQGGASVASGEMEVMLHRRLLHDDWRGVGEPLNETACGCRDCDCHGLVVRGKHLVSLHDPNSAAVARRTLQQRLNDPPVLVFLPLLNEAVAGGLATQQLQPSGKLFQGSRPLPPQAHLLTLKRLHNDKLLVRLAHLYQAGEEGSGEHGHVVVSLDDLFGDTRITSVEEMALDGAQRLSDVRRLRWRAGESITRSDWPRGVAADEAARGQYTEQGQDADQTEAAQPTRRARSLKAWWAGDWGIQPGSPASRSSSSSAGACVGDTPLSCRSWRCRVHCGVAVRLRPMEIRTFVVELPRPQKN